MGLAHSPSIVTNGLAFCLDAANKKSYPGTGTTWTDLSGNNLNGTLTNGPTFSNTNSGRINFDGTNDIVIVGQTTSSIQWSFTIELWCMPTLTHQIDTESSSGTGGTSGQRYVFEPLFMGSYAGAGVSVGTNGVSVYEHGNAYMPALLVSQTSISSTLMTHIVVVYIDKVPRLYLNGALDRIGLLSGRTIIYPTIYSIGAGTYGAFGGSVSVVKVYNRPLTEAEVTQNFNALRGRFNI